MTQEPEQRGVEYPSLEKSPPQPDLPPPVDYPDYPPPSPGYPQQGYPQQGYPQPGYPQPYPYGVNPYGPQAGSYGVPPYGVPPQARTNGLAIGSLVTSLVGVPACFGFGVTSIVAIVLGVVAMNQIKTSGERGHGMALAGVIIGVVTLVLFVLFLVIGIAADSTNT